MFRTRPLIIALLFVFFLSAPIATSARAADEADSPGQRLIDSIDGVWYGSPTKSIQYQTDYYGAAFIDSYIDGWREIAGICIVFDFTGKTITGCGSRSLRAQSILEVRPLGENSLIVRCRDEEREKDHDLTVSLNRDGSLFAMFHTATVLERTRYDKETFTPPAPWTEHPNRGDRPE